MRIVCLTDDSPGGRYTVNAIHSKHGVTLAVAERAKRRFIVSDLKQMGIRDTLHRGALVARRLFPNRSDARVLDRFLGAGTWRSFPEAVDRITTGDINGPATREAIRQARPDVIVCHGTRLIKDPAGLSAAYPLNIHHGISPWYRGSRCNEWALATGDVHNIGVTVHMLTAEVDGGPVVGQMRLSIEDGDSMLTITSRVIASGLRITNDIISLLRNGGNLRLLPQPSGAGSVMRRRQYSRFVTKHVEELLRRRAIPQMLRYPSAAPKPLLAPWPPEEDRNP
jgi:folate-dependent phosphoribosylglycinamide formyltransferase PurN